MTWLAKMLGIDRLAAVLIVAVLAVSAAGGAYLYVDHKGYNRGYDAAAGRYKATIATMKAAAVEARDKEASRQEAANNAAKAREAQRIAEIEAENQSLEQKIEELRREADQDPDASRSAVNAPGVRRINQIR